MLQYPNKPSYQIFHLLMLLAILGFSFSPSSSPAQTAEIFLQTGHSSNVQSVTYSADGQTLASGSSDNTVKLWDAKTGELLRTLSGHTGGVLSVTYSADDRTLASGSSDNTVKLWDAKTGELLRTLSGHTGDVASVTYNADDRTLASGSSDNSVKLWDTKTGELLRTLSGHTDDVVSVTYNADDQTLASGSSDNTVKLWDTKTGELLRTLSGHTDDVVSVTYNADDQTLASGSSDNTVKLWDTKTGELLRTLSGHTNSVMSVTYSPDGQTMASGSADDTIKLWNAKKGELLRTLSGHASSVSSVTYSPDGQTLTSGSSDNTVKLWDAKTGELLRTLSGHTNSVMSVTYSPDGQTMASGSSDNTVKLWDAKTGELLRTLSGHTDRIMSVTYSPNGQTLASGGADNTIKLWDAMTGKLLHTIVSEHIYSFLLGNEVSILLSKTYSPDGQTLASSGTGGNIKLWDVKTGKLLRTLSGHNTLLVMSVTYSPDGQTMASGSWDDTVKLWDAKTGKLLRTLSGHTGNVSSVTYSPDSQTLASGSSDNTVKLWDAKTGKLLRTLSGHTSSVSSVTYSPDGQTLTSGSSDNTVRLWNAKTGELLRTLSGHTNSVMSVTYSPDGQTLASGSSDNTVKLWDAKTGELEFQYVTLPGGEWIAFAPENSKLFYNASLQGDEYAAIRFDNHPPLYPLYYYRDELHRSDLSVALLGPSVQIVPKLYRLRWDRLENVTLWISGTLFLLLVIAGYVLLLQRRSDPMEVARNFFKHTDFRKVETRDKNLMILHPQIGMTWGVVALWEATVAHNSEILALSIEKLDLQGEKKLYWVYKGSAPDHEAVAQLRKQLQCDIIPFSSPILERAISEDNCNETLKNLEEPYLVRGDPYAEAKPIHDPNWFYGREGYLSRLPKLLTQGQHVGVFGLRKVGKTSLINQLRQRSVAMPAAFIDCQGFSPDPVFILREIQKQLWHELADLSVKKLPRQKEIATTEDFQEAISNLFDLWKAFGRTEPFLLILDEIDKLFPNREVRNSEHTLHEYVRLFKVIRGLAQSQRSLVVLAVAYRPDINRYNQLSDAVGENPMFKSYHEEYLGFLNAEESYKMIVEIGEWKDIVWDQDAARRVFAICGGHPLITRYFASHASEQGSQKHIDLNRVEQSARKLEKTLRKNDIGNYYKEAVWALLRSDEQAVLQQIHQNGEQGLLETEISVELEEALTNLEQFGVIENFDGKIQCTGELFRHWLKRNLSS